MAAYLRASSGEEGELRRFLPEAEVLRGEQDARRVRRTAVVELALLTVGIFLLVMFVRSRNLLVCSAPC